MRHTLAAFLLTAPLAAQTLEPGYAVPNLFSLPNGASNVLVLRGGAEVVYFTGTDLVLRGGGTQRTLLSLASAVFGSFTIDAGAGRVLFGESSSGDLWLVPLAAGSAPRVVANLPLNYDAVAIAPDEVIVSAKRGGPSSPDNDLIHVDLVSGATDLIARVPGASGPVDWTNDGLYYATASSSFPPPPGATDVLLWSRWRVRGAIGPTHLGVQEAFVVATGLDSAGDLAVDEDFDVLVTDWVNSRVLEVSIGFVNGGNGEVRRAALLAYPATAPQPTSLQLDQPRRLSPQFEPFQPEAGGVLHVHESTFGGTSRIRSVAPARPVTTAPTVVPPGAFTVSTRGGPANGSGVVAVGWNLLPRENFYPVPGFEQLVLWDPSMFRAWDTIPVSFDAQGTAQLPLFNPGTGGAAFSVGVQCAFVDARLEVLGSAAPLVLDLR